MLSDDILYKEARRQATEDNYGVVLALLLIAKVLYLWMNRTTGDRS